MTAHRLVTFLLTDIEGSTALWDVDPVAMAHAVGRQDALLAEAVTRHGGVVVKSRGEGDSAFTVFAEPADAVAAALDAQRALSGESWPTREPIAVRMAIHRGEAEVRDGDYYGPVVNRCARLRALAHGGQTLLSAAAARAVAERLPEGASLAELGPALLRGLAERELVFELRHADLAPRPAPVGVSVLDFRLLGPLEVLAAGEPLAVGRGKQRALLVLLLLRPGELVLVDRLIDELWAGSPPPTAAAALQVYVSRLRKLLPAGSLVTEGKGYRLVVDPQQVDTYRFAALVEEGRAALAAGDWQGAVRALDAALAAWRGPALADVAYEPFAQPEIARLEELRLVALEERIEAELTGGRAPEVVSRLEALVAEHPLRERLRGQLMVALYRAGRQADALAAYRGAREALVEELGIEPGPQLRELEMRILAQDAGLMAPLPATAETRPAQAVARVETEPRNLPVPSTSFVGRERELTALREHVSQDRLVTIRGPGGAGKTRLALRAAEELAAEFADGAWWVDLAPLAEGRAVWSTLASALGIAEQPGREPDEDVVEALAPRQTLLVIDNCEHLLDAVREVAGALLARCPGVRLLATSRERLGHPAELVWEIPGMAADALTLFAERAVRAVPGYVLDGRRADIARRICGRLDGMPLAIELAAARLSVLSVEQIEERLADRFRLLTRGSADAPARHGSLRAVVDWSYELLSEVERSALARAAVFRGDFDIDAAEAVLPGGPLAERDVLDTLAELVDKSLLGRREEDGRVRYRPHETIRAYAAERLDERGEVDEIRDRHAAYFLSLAERAEPHLGAASREWLERLEQDHDNLRAALDHLEATGRIELELRLAGAIAEFWDERGHQVEGRRRLERALLADERPTAARAKALNGAAALALSGGDAETAQRWAGEALMIHRDIGDALGTAESALQLGGAVGNEGDLSHAAELLEESRRLFDQVGEEDRSLVAGRYLAWALHGLGDVQGERALHEENLRRARARGNDRLVASTLGALGMMALDEGRLGEAASLLGECHRMHRDRGDLVQVGLNLCRLARLAALAGRPDNAARLLAAFETAQRRVGGSVPWVATLNEETHRLVRADLDDAAFAKVWAEGCDMPADDAVALALEGTREQAL